MMRGRLIYVMGPSGAGKNSVIANARSIAGSLKKINKNNCLYFSPRYVTRPATLVDSASDECAISTGAFAHYKRIGAFALDWEAHGFCYGVSTAIDTLLRAGKCVVVNGSRDYLATALEKYPHMTTVLITVAPDVAYARLLARGRENIAAIMARVQRAPDITVPQQQLHIIDNSGPLEHATAALLHVLLGHEAAAVKMNEVMTTV
jgi:ribose 1,5-bisphosphokinase